MSGREAAVWDTGNPYIRVYYTYSDRFGGQLDRLAGSLLLFILYSLLEHGY